MPTRRILPLCVVSRTNTGQWKAKYFPEDYATHAENITFTITTTTTTTTTTASTTATDADADADAYPAISSTGGGRGDNTSANSSSDGIHSVPIGGGGGGDGGGGGGGGGDGDGGSGHGGRVLGTPGAWRSHFAGTAPNADPGVHANASLGMFFLVRDKDGTRGFRTEGTHTTAGGGAGAGAGVGTVSWTVEVGVNEMVTLSTATAGVPDAAPALPSAPPTGTDGCTFPTKLSNDFDGTALAAAPAYFQDMHGAFEVVADPSPPPAPGTLHRQEGAADVNARGPAGAGVHWRNQGRGRGAGSHVLRQMAVGQPLGFHCTDNPPLSIIGSKAVAVGGGASFRFKAPTSHGHGTHGGGRATILREVGRRVGGSSSTHLDPPSHPNGGQVAFARPPARTPHGAHA